MTPTVAATRSTAAIVIGNNIVTSVRRIETGADPCDRRHLRARRTGIYSSSATAAERAVNGAIAPVIALGGIARILRITGALRQTLAGIRIQVSVPFAVGASRDRQQRQA